MPKIQLEINSPEYAARAAYSHPPSIRCCDMPGCKGQGDHRAPKDRSLNEYFWFCLDHVQEYNAAWDFFAGMQPIDMEKHIVESLYGDRPTWRSDIYRGLESELKRKIHDAYHFTEEQPDSEEKRIPTGNPEIDALSVLGLQPPAPFNAVKKRYRELVKKYHPDHNPPNAETEDLIKQVNMAYTILKMAYASTTVL